MDITSTSSEILQMVGFMKLLGVDVHKIKHPYYIQSQFEVRIISMIKHLSVITPEKTHSLSKLGFDYVLRCPTSINRIDDRCHNCIFEVIKNGMILNCTCKRHLNILLNNSNVSEDDVKISAILETFYNDHQKFENFKEILINFVKYSSGNKR